MKTNYIYTVLCILFIIGCGGGSTHNNTPECPESNDSSRKKIIITDDIHVESLGMESNIHINLKTGNTPKDIFIFFSNYSPSETANISIRHNNAIVNHTQYTALKKEVPNRLSHILHTPARIHQFIKNIHNNPRFERVLSPHKSRIMPVRRANMIGESKEFYLDLYTSPSSIATLQQIVSNVQTDQGSKTLNIWVSNDSFDSGSGCSKQRCITQTMVNSLANNFLKSGSNNDIYDWVTNIYGKAWGNDAQLMDNNLIADNDEITILLTDIDNDNSPEGGVLGYFYPKDNYKNTSFSGSNERIMFYIDSVMFANYDNETWNIDDYWPKEIISTLAHEFQHMIHFYQKDILLNTETETWLNEMLAEGTEDLVATKILNTGPRGVDYIDGSAGISGNTLGRYPIFNAHNIESLTHWGNGLSDYAHVNSFGAFLLRNYGGADLFHNIVHNVYGDEDAIVNAINQNANDAKTFNDLLREWGTGVMLSDQTNLQSLPSYNSGDFTYSEYNGVSYALGSVNFFNYSPYPMMHSSTGIVRPQANYYYKVGSNISGNIDIDLTLNGTVEATLICK